MKKNREIILQEREMVIQDDLKGWIEYKTINIGNTLAYTAQEKHKCPNCDGLM